MDTAAASITTSSTQDSVVSSTTSLADMFKPAAGSWECTSCLVRNKAEDTVCVACGTGLDGAAPAESVPDSKPAFSFGIKTDAPASTSSLTSQFSFGIKDSKPATFSFGIPQSTEASSSQGTFTFGAVKSSQDSSTVSDTKPTFSFGIPGGQTSTPFSFTFNTTSTSTAASTSSTVTSAFSAPSFTSVKPVAIPKGTEEQRPATPTKTESTSFVFGSPDKYEFSFSGVKAKSPRSRDVSLCESEDGVVEEDEGEHLYFEVE